MRSVWWLAGLLCLGCGGESSSDGSPGTGGTDGGAGQGGTGGSGGSTGGSGGFAGASTGGSSGSGTVCGGLGGITCAANEFCDFTPDTCGAGDLTGVCTIRPDGCPELEQPTCGCDGAIHGNSCEAQAAGTDVSENGGCLVPVGHFPCGPTFCDGTNTYCQKVTDDTGGPTSYTCNALPTACVGQADCSCFPADTPCVDICEVVFGNGPYGFVITCPGG
jgi:hypothetical protein